MTRILNPKTGRYIMPDKRVYNDLIRNGYIHDKQSNTLIPRQTNCLMRSGGTMGNVSILDTDIPDIGVEPLKPTKFQAFKSEVVKNAGKMASWLWKLIQNRSKNANNIADWILNQKDKIINKVLPPKLVELIELSKNIIYKNKDSPANLITECKKAFKNNMTEYDITILNKTDPLIQMKLLDDSINALLYEKLKKLQGLKFNIGMEILFQKDDSDGNIIQNSFTFTVNAQTLTNENQISNAVHSMNQNINNRIDQFTSQGSGWVVGEVTRHFMAVNKYNPLAARSYIMLPDDIANRKATINIQNEDDKCFMYCLGRALDPNPEKHHLERVNKHLIDVCHELGLDEIEMPVSIKDIPNIEKKFGISINIFGHNFYNDTQEIYPILLTKLSDVKHVNLLVTSNDVTNHYILVKDFNRLCSNVTKHNGEKHFCMNCIQHFSSSEILERHKQDCMLVNGKQAVDLPEINSKIKFSNLKNLVPVPFVIYADLEALLIPIQSRTADNAASYTLKTHKHEACSYGYKVVCCENDKFSKPFKMFRGEDSVYKFFEALFEEEKEIQQHMKKFKRTDMILTKDQITAHAIAKECYVCHTNFTAEVKKVRDHCHVSGNYRGAACDKLQFTNEAHIQNPCCVSQFKRV